MYVDLLSDIEQMFATTAWTSNSIPIYPDNYQGKINDKGEFCRLNILPSIGENYAYGVQKRISGLVIIKILVKAGLGQKRVMQIADILDGLLQNKHLTNGTELGASYVSMEGLDTANNALYSARYTIPFKIHGE